MRRVVYDYPPVMPDDEKIDYRFILAGYSWKFSEFKIWHISFQKNINKFSYRSVGLYPKPQNNGRIFNFIGDEIGEARRRLNNIITDRVLADGELNWEPFEVLRDMCIDEKYHTIGGIPQVVKIYKFMKTLPYNIVVDNEIYFGGRKLMGFEKNNWPSLDLRSLSVKT